MKDFKIKLIVAGGRKFKDYQYLKKCLDFMLQNYETNEVQIVCGEAEGADLLGRRYAESLGINVASFPAEWDNFEKEPCKIVTRYGRTYNCLAGYNRNKEMGVYATHLVAFWNGSNGTKQMIDYMTSLGKPVKIFKWD